MTPQIGSFGPNPYFSLNRWFEHPRITLPFYGDSRLNGVILDLEVAHLETPFWSHLVSYIGKRGP